MKSFAVKLNISAFILCVFMGINWPAWGAEETKPAEPVPAQDAPAQQETAGAAENAVTDESAAKSDAADQNSAQVATENATPEQAVYPGVKNILYKNGNDNEPHAIIWYPSFGNKFVDEDIKYFVAVQGADFRKDVEDSAPENEEKPASYDQWELTGFYTLSRPNPDVASITFNIYSYVGGAHGNLFIRCLNYDLKNNKQLEMDDVFGDKNKAIEILSAYTEKKLREELGSETDEDMLKAGTSAEEYNFLNFSLNKDGIVIEFQPYQVGPWSIGPQSVAVPLEELAAAKPNPIIWPDTANKTE